MILILKDEKNQDTMDRGGKFFSKKDCPLFYQVVLQKTFTFHISF